jgi:drug/metabolite transporter (DMT)-like permease
VALSVRESTRGIVYVLGATAGFGTIGIFGELALRAEIALSTLLPVRFVVALGILAGIAVLRGWAWPASSLEWGATLALGVVYTGMTVLYFSSLVYLTAGLATIVLYTYPTMVVVLAVWLLEEALTRLRVLALVLATAGVAIVVGADLAAVAPVGIGLALGAAICYAVYTLGSRRLSPVIRPRPLMIGVLLGTTLSMAGYGALDGGLALPVGSAQWEIVLGLALLSTVVPHLLFYEGVARLQASQVGVLSTTEVLVTVLLGVVLLGEPVTTVLVGGGLLVVAGVLLVNADRPTEAAPGARDH